MDIDTMLNFSYLDMAKAIIDRFNDLLRLSDRIFPFKDLKSPLQLAVRRNTGDINEIQTLLDKGCDINVINGDGRNLLHEAVMNAQCTLGLVKVLLKKQPNLINRLDRLKKSALHMAMMFDNYKDVIEELLNQGADINARDIYMETPLHVAANFRHDLYMILLERGASVNPRNCYMRTPLHCALMKLAPHLNVPLIHALLSHGADVNARDRGQNSVLHYACRNTQVNADIIRLLLEYGAIPDLLDERGMPPLGYCTNREVSQLLIQYSVFYRFNLASNSKNEIIVADSMLNLEFSRRQKKRMWWIQFRDACLTEILLMMSDRMNSRYTLYKYVSERYNKKTISEKETIPNRVFLRLSNNTYPSCKDIIYASVKHNELLRKLRDMPFYTVRSSMKNIDTIYLNVYCVDHIVKYLSKSDIMHLITAFLDTEFFSSKVNRKIAIPIKRKPEDQSILRLVCKRLKVSITDNFNYETGLKILP